MRFLVTLLIVLGIKRFNLFMFHSMNRPRLGPAGTLQTFLRPSKPLLKPSHNLLIGFFMNLAYFALTSFHFLLDPHHLI